MSKALVLLFLPLFGCAVGRGIEPITAAHPASPEAPEAPSPKPSDTLSLEDDGASSARENSVPTIGGMQHGNGSGHAHH